jgi:hypothetical protein
MRRRFFLSAASLSLVLGVCAFLLAAAPGIAAPPITRTIPLGSVFYVKGETGSVSAGGARATGKVVAKGVWESGKPYPITVTFTDAAGGYRLHVQPGRRGVLTLRILPPDHVVHVFVLRVV